MKLKIGEKIKQLRKEKNLTQEEFSEVLGVSCQSVSRWENAGCYPDVELIPTIASFFGISTDKLMGIDEETEKTAVKKYINDFQEAISVGDIDKCIQIARTGVAEYPNNYELLNKLMYALFIAGDDTGNIPNWKENQQKYESEIIALGERISKYCENTDIRLEATSRLAFLHCEMGRKSIGRKIYETLPTMYQCRESAIWWGLEKDEKLPHLRDYIEKSYALLMEGLSLLIHYIPTTDAIKVLDKIYEINKIMYDGNPPLADNGNTYDHFQHAKFCMKLNRPDEAIKHLKIAAESAIAFDDRPDEEIISTVIFGEKTERKTDFDTADSRPYKEILRDSWLEAEEFNKIRETNEFEELIRMLS